MDRIGSWTDPVSKNKEDRNYGRHFPGIGSYIKPLVGRIRPYDINTAVGLLIPRPTDFSFPSGHTGASFAAAAALEDSNYRLRIPAWVLAVLIAFSRLYLYVHYPTDVLAGAMLGILTGWTATEMVRLFGKKFATAEH